MRRLCLAFASSALLAGVGVSAGCNGGGSGDGDGDTDDFGDADAGESGIDSTATAESTATATATAGDDDWGDEGDDDGWGDDASEDDGANGVCAYEGVYGFVEEVGPLAADPGSVHSYYCEVGEVEFESGGGWSQLRTLMACREGNGPEFETGLSMEASPAFERFVDEGDRLRITRGFVASGPEQGLRLAIERDGEGRILSFVEGASLNSPIGPDPTLPFFRGVESMGCTATEGVTCGEGPAQRLVFETPAGVTRVGHQEAKLGQPPGDLNVWVSEAFTTNSPSCDSAVKYTVLMIRS